MGFITVERHVFFVKPQEYTNQAEHLWVRHKRVPMGKTSDRTVKYLDDSIFGALPVKIAGGSLQALQNFFLGKGHPFPKLIVADVRAGDLYDKPGMQKLMFERWRRKHHTNMSGVPANPPQFPDLSEERNATWAENMAKYYAEKTNKSSWSRDKNLGVHGADHRPHYLEEHHNEVWLLQDPTKPGKVTVSLPRAKVLGKQVLDRNFKDVLVMTDVGGKRVMDQDSVIILGVAYRLDYRQNQMPVDAVHLEAIDRRVRKYLMPFLKDIESDFDKAVDQGPVRTYYAMGKRPLPPKSTRWKATPSGRVRQYSTFRKGRGLEPITVQNTEQIVPLFTVKAKNIDAARMSAQRLLNRKRWSRNPAEREKWIERGLQWFNNGREMITVGALRMLHAKRQ